MLKPGTKFKVNTKGNGNFRNFREGTIIREIKKIGKSTKHRIQFNNGNTQNLVLSKNGTPNGNKRQFMITGTKKNTSKKKI